MAVNDFTPAHEAWLRTASLMDREEFAGLSAQQINAMTPGEFAQRAGYKMFEPYMAVYGSNTAQAELDDPEPTPVAPAPWRAAPAPAYEAPQQLTVNDIDWASLTPEEYAQVRMKFISPSALDQQRRGSAYRR